MCGPLQDEGRLVGIVGDGVNDAPARPRGCPHRHGDRYRRGHRVVGPHPHLERAATARGRHRPVEGRGTDIRNDLVGAFGYNTPGIPIAAGVLYPFLGILLSPMIAAVAMALSSLTVVVNANRMRCFTAPALEGDHGRDGEQAAERAPTAVACG